MKKLIMFFLLSFFVFSCSSNKGAFRDDEDFIGEKNEIEETSNENNLTEEDMIKEAKSDKKAPNWVKNINKVTVKKEGNDYYIYFSVLNEMVQNDIDFSMDIAETKAITKFSSLMNETLDILVKKNLIKVVSTTNSRINNIETADKYISKKFIALMLKVKITEELLQMNNIKLSIKEFLKYVPKKL